MPQPSRLLIAASRLLPRRFRDRFDEDFASLVAQLATDARARGRRARVVYVLRELVGVLSLAWTLRRQARVPDRSSRRSTMVDRLQADLLWSVRVARRRPLASGAVMFTLALGIAVAATSFGVASAILWRPLPFADGDRLVFVWEQVERDGIQEPFRLTGARFGDWQRHSQGLEGLALFGAAAFTADGPQGATTLRGVRVSPHYFDTLGISPIRGRGFSAADATSSEARVIVLSHAFWQQWFGGRDTVLGERLRLSGELYTVVGVMPPVTFPAWPVNPGAVTIEPDARLFWVPLEWTPRVANNTRSHVYGAIGRLAPGTSLEEAAAELNGLAVDMSADRHGARLMPLREQFVRDARAPLLALLGASLAVLLVACANLAAVQVSSLEGRRSELGIRIALGAGRARLARQLASEALLLVLGGGFAGLLLTRVVLVRIPDQLPATVPFVTSPEFDWRVAAFAVGLSLFAWMVLAAWPLGRWWRAAPASRGVAPVARGLVYRALVVAQIALTLGLVYAASLLSQSLWTVRGQDPGFVVDRVLVAEVSFVGPAYADPARVVAAERRLTEALLTIPGVARAAIAYDHPLEANWSDSFLLSGSLPGRDDVRGAAELRIVSPEYFESLGVQVLAGRSLTERDDLEAPGAVVVNESYARTVTVTGSVVGRELRSATPSMSWNETVPTSFRIVGIVEDERFRGLEEATRPAVYMSTRQFPQHGFTVLVRTQGDPLRVAPDVRAAIRRVDSTAPVGRVTTLEAILDEQLVTRRATTDVLGTFALTGLGLAALGVYGLLAMLVTSRRREIGVRLALGAPPRSIGRLVVAESVVLGGIGVLAGLLLTLPTGTLVRSLLVGISPSDPTTIAAVSTTILLVAILAAWLPARRAAHVDPVTTLRSD